MLNKVNINANKYFFNFYTKQYEINVAMQIFRVEMISKCIITVAKVKNEFTVQELKKIYNRLHFVTQKFQKKYLAMLGIFFFYWKL